MTRNEFLQMTIGLAATTLFTAACGSGDGYEDPADGPRSAGAAPAGATTTNCGDATIGTNHGHAMTVSKADVDAGVAKTYAIAGTSGHAHDVELAAEHFTKLKAGEAVEVISSTDGGHAHTVSIRCA